MTVDEPVYAAYLPEIVECAAEAGRRIMKIYSGGFSVTHKRDHSPLTDADLASQAYILDRLHRLDPDIPVLAEEAEETPYEARRAWARVWLVDPLDGTKEFVKRNGEFTINIGLVENGKTVLGVVHAPALGLTYFAAKGGGAYKQEGARAVAVHARRYPGHDPVVAISRSHANVHVERFLAGVRSQEGEPHILRMGSALKMCLVAEGAADVYPRLGPTSEWDTAAAQCIVEAAGGSITDGTRRALAYNKASLLNPWFLAAGAGTVDWWRYAASASAAGA